MHAEVCTKPNIAYAILGDVTLFQSVTLEISKIGYEVPTVTDNSMLTFDSNSAGCSNYTRSTSSYMFTLARSCFLEEW